MKHQPTLTALPDVPTTIGTWVRVDRVARHEERVTFRVTYETPVGGTVAHRFSTQRLATEYVKALLGTNPWAAVHEGRTVTH